MAITPLLWPKSALATLFLGFNAWHEQIERFLFGSSVFRSLSVVVWLRGRNGMVEGSIAEEGCMCHGRQETGGRYTLLVTLPVTCLSWWEAWNFGGHFRAKLSYFTRTTREESTGVYCTLLRISWAFWGLASRRPFGYPDSMISPDRSRGNHELGGKYFTFNFTNITEI